ncbi:MAG: hypothetical protein JSW25_00260 [Thermoplasmata archaeon]|nr:MAG: hypothetical protein JSW25_00260 [Thermoplasmata archaeon]
MDVRRILDTIREVDEWTKRKQDLERRMSTLPRKQRSSMRAELEIVRQQLAHYQALVEEMKLAVTRPAVSAFLEDM